MEEFPKVTNLLQAEVEVSDKGKAFGARRNLPFFLRILAERHLEKVVSEEWDVVKCLIKKAQGGVARLSM